MIRVKITTMLKIMKISKSFFVTYWKNQMKIIKKWEWLSSFMMAQSLVLCIVCSKMTSSRPPEGLFLEKL